MVCYALGAIFPTRETFNVEKALTRTEFSASNFVCLKIARIFHRLAFGSIHFKPVSPHTACMFLVPAPVGHSHIAIGPLSWHLPAMVLAESAQWVGRLVGASYAGMAVSGFRLGHNEEPHKFSTNLN